jgi:uncharacterized membrane protein AbrB (regulator of aidB expression)
MPKWDERHARLALTLALALAGAVLCARLRVPLPWMIGPLLVTAGCGWPACSCRPRDVCATVGCG